MCGMCQTKSLSNKNNVFVETIFDDNDDGDDDDSKTSRNSRKDEKMRSELFSKNLPDNFFIILSYFYIRKLGRTHFYPI